jgi:hypothetical protein
MMNSTTLIIGIIVVLVLPVVVAMALAVRRQWMWVAVTMATPALPLQLLGLTSTCTQGADGTFVAGAIYSAPFLLVAALSSLWTVRLRTGASSAATVTVLVPLLMFFLTHNAWVNSLLYGSPCGEDYAGIFGSSPTNLVIILVGYLALPLLLIGSAMWAALRSQNAPAASADVPKGQ